MADPYEQYETETQALWDLIQDSGIENADDLDQDVLDTVLLRSMTTKAPLAKLLGLGSDHRLTFQVADTNSEGIENDRRYEIFRIFILHYSHHLVPTQDADGRDLLTMVKENLISLKAEDKNPVRFSRHLGRLDLQEAWVSYLDENPARTSFLRETERRWDVFVSAVFDRVKASTRDVTITCNPLDLMLSSEECPWDSCHEFDGCHANGNLGYLKDDFTAMIMLREPNVTNYPFKKTARMFLYVPASYDRFLIARAYGTITDTQSRAISDRISTAIATAAGIENKWVGVMINTTGKDDKAYPSNKIQNAGHLGLCGDRHSNYAVYFDRAVTRFVYHKSLRTEGTHEAHYPMLGFKNATCLQCGDSTSAAQHLRCEECRNSNENRTTCASCDETCDADESYTYQDNHYCESCFNEDFYTCAHCDESRREANTNYRLPDGNGTICRGCYTSHYSTCTDCDNVVLDTDITHISDHGDVCDDCKTDYTPCDHCDEWRDSGELTHIMDTERYACSDCIKEHASECCDCSDYHQTTVTHLGDVYCTDCRDKRVDEAEAVFDGIRQEARRERGMKSRETFTMRAAVAVATRERDVPHPQLFMKVVDRGPKLRRPVTV